MPLFKLCLAKDISTKKAHKFTLDDQDILIAKSMDNTIWAFDAMCSHAEKPLENGRWNAEKSEITCPFHKAIFAIAEQGAVKAPPAFAPLAVYKVVLKYENEEEFIFIEKDWYFEE